MGKLLTPTNALLEDMKRKQRRGLNHLPVTLGGGGGEGKGGGCQ